MFHLNGLLQLSARGKYIVFKHLPSFQPCFTHFISYLSPVLLLGVRVHVSKASQNQSFHQRPLHGAGQQVEGRAAGGKLLRQVPPALTLHHDVRPERTEGGGRVSVRVCARVGSTYMF